VASHRALVLRTARFGENNILLRFGEKDSIAQNNWQKAAPWHYRLSGSAEK
jgi:hypothetical protein